MDEKNRLNLLDSDKGASLVSLIIGLSGMMISSAAGLFVINKLNAFTSSVENIGTVNELSGFIRKNIDCEATFAAANIDWEDTQGQCISDSSIQKPPYLKLYLRSPSGPQSLTKGPINGGTESYGSWKIRSSCSEKDSSLIIRVAKMDKNNNFFAHPITMKALDFYHNRHLIAGASKPLCFSEENIGSDLTKSIGILTANVFKMTLGPSDSIVPLYGVLPHPSTGDTGTYNGIRCDNNKGWKILNCTLRIGGQKSMILPYDNGCLTYSNVVGDTTLQISCVK